MYVEEQGGRESLCRMRQPRTRGRFGSSFATCLLLIVLSFASFGQADKAESCPVQLAGECLRLGLKDLDASLLQSHIPRKLTQLASLEVRRRGFDGIYYRSRHGHDLENWALFEPFSIKHAATQAIATDDPDFLNALRILGLKLGP
jgi:hypothetical protein